MPHVLRRLSPVQRYLLSAFLVVAGVVSLGIIVDQAVLPAISHSANEVTVPSLVGLPLEAAKGRLDSMGLVVKEVREQFSTSVPEGSVMSQMPFAGSVVKEGRHVYITVSTGEETVTMPSLSGMSIRDARVALMRAGLTLGDVVYESDDSVPNGSVLRQSIAPRSLVAYGTAIQATISSGPSGSSVPDVQGQPIDVATEVLQAAGFSLGRISYVQSGLFESQTIVRQFPRDTVIPRGTAIDVDVAR